MLIALMTVMFMSIGYLLGGGGGMMIALVIAVAMNLFGYWNSDKMARTYNAQEVDERSAPRYYRMVSGLAANAGLPMPKVYIIHEDQPNAFATGCNPENAAVAATTGLLNRLSPEEVAGVMAHELAHVQNRDTLTMTIVATLAGAISMLGNFCFLPRRQSRKRQWRHGRRRHASCHDRRTFGAMIVQMAVSRTPRICRRQARRGNLRQSAVALLRARQDRAWCQGHPE